MSRIAPNTRSVRKLVCDSFIQIPSPSVAPTYSPKIAPTWHWATLEGGPATIDPEAVYLPDVLVDITARAARAARAR